MFGKDPGGKSVGISRGMQLMNTERERYGLLDTIRGLTLLSMICYHGVWDLVYLYGVKWDWYLGRGAYVWQQSICWTVILLSGFCWPLGKKPFKRGVLVFGCGCVITLVTCLFMPENRVVFGVLTLIGSCMLIMIPVHRLLNHGVRKKGIAAAGLTVSFLLFFLSRNINRGFLGFEGWNMVKLPEGWYQGMVSTCLGFTAPSFYSTDYFSLFPWFFLFLGGYFLYYVLQRDKGLSPVFTCEFVPLRIAGRYSLPVYMLHQPVLYLIFSFLC